MKKSFTYYFLISLLGFLFFQSCSLVKYVPEGERLYTGTRRVIYDKVGNNPKEWKINDFAEKSTNAVMTLWISPNGALFGVPYTIILPLRLYVYNWFYTETDKGFSHWMMNNFGEPPITMNQVSPDLRVKSIENQLFNKGHFGVKGEYEIRQKGDKKASVRYIFKIPSAYTFRNIDIKLDSAQNVLRPSIDKYMESSKIIPGEDFDLDNIAEEKQLLWEHLQNEGYYYFRKNDLLILADTSVGNRQVDLQYRIVQDLPENYFKKTYINNKWIILDSDSLVFVNDKILSGKGVEVKERLINKIVEISEDSLYSLNKTRKTIRNIGSVGMFQGSVIEYSPSLNDSTSLNATIDLKSVDMFNLGISGGVTQKNTGFVGPGLEVYANQRNLWGGAENLNLRLDGYLDFPYGVLSDRTSRSSGFSATATLSAPVLRSPLQFISRRSILIPQRSISFGFELNNRAEYFTIAEWKGSYQLTWYTQPKISHELGILNINYLNLLKTTSDFDTLMSESQVVENSYSSKFITGPSYAFTYNNTAGEYRKFRSYYRAEIELAGNLLNGAYWLAGKREKNQKFLGVEFSQYIRFTSDLRAYLGIGNRGSEIAFRSLIGIGRAYGNSNLIPYPKQFYIGGSNSLRPITARVLGPGRYLEFDERSMNQVGDIKIETNLEYRFRIAYLLYGAVWSDLGNIWLFNEDPERPGSGIRFDKILEDSYLTSGIGLRADLDFLVLRADYGAVLYLPFIVERDYRWLWNNNLPVYGLVFGIGYPF
jgi:hypothetical protein